LFVVFVQGYPDLFALSAGSFPCFLLSVSCYFSVAIMRPMN
jgi:hypothetical protein